MNVAVIPARGGSKRIARKNIREFAGVPMIAHSIRRALESELFDRVIVSTDDREIAELSRQFGATIPFMRPPELADDHAPTVPVVAHAVEWLRANGLSPAAVCCIYATAPFLDARDLAAGLALLDSAPWRYVFSATTYAFPISRSFAQGGDGSVAMFYPEHRDTRSQDLAEALHDAGQFYWGRPDAWAAGEPIIAGGSTVVRIPRWRVQDIDTTEDWERAEMLLPVVQRMAAKGKG